MGGTSYSDAAYASRLADAAATGTDVFKHTASIRSGATPVKVHPSLDPSRLNKLGKLIRESFDSDLHPESLPISIIFDITGSMQNVPRTFMEKLGGLMKLLTQKGYVKHPHLMFGAVGDATCNRVPIQIGQFEAGDELVETLSLIHLEGGGGGGYCESYELSMYYLARHSDLHSLTKRNKKGYLFLMGDELPYKNVSKTQVKSHIGDDLQDDIPTSEILKELRSMYEVFWILPGGTSNFTNPTINTELRNMFGQNLLILDNPNDICGLISSTIGLNEGRDLSVITTDLGETGESSKSISNITTTLEKYAATAAVTKATGEFGLTDSKKKRKIVTNTKK